MSAPTSPAPVSLDRLPKGAGGSICGFAGAPELEAKLRELGLAEGDAVEIVETGPLGARPLAVRSGPALFALRRDEAAAVLVAPSAPAGRAPRP